MSKVILAINAGSSSVKISIYKADQDQEPIELAETQIDGLTSPPPKLKYTRGGKLICKDKEIGENISSQKDAVEFLLDELIDDKDLKEITKKEDIHIACHRVVCSLTPIPIVPNVRLIGPKGSWRRLRHTQNHKQRNLPPSRNTYRPRTPPQRSSSRYRAVLHRSPPLNT